MYNEYFLDHNLSHKKLWLQDASLHILFNLSDLKI